MNNPPPVRGTPGPAPCASGETHPVSRMHKHHLLSLLQVGCDFSLSSSRIRQCPPLQLPEVPACWLPPRNSFPDFSPGCGLDSLKLTWRMTILTETWSMLQVTTQKTTESRGRPGGFYYDTVSPTLPTGHPLIKACALSRTSTFTPYVPGKTGMHFH